MKGEETHQSITRDIYSLPYCHYWINPIHDNLFWKMLLYLLQYMQGKKVEKLAGNNSMLGINKGLEVMVFNATFDNIPVI